MGGEGDKDGRTSAQYADLLKASQAQDYERVVKICNRILHLNPNDETAFKTKIISLVQLNEFSQALDGLDKKPKLCGGLEYERAYCYYRLQRMEEAKEVLVRWKECPFKKKELLCQIHYRMDKLEEAYDMAKDLLKNSEDDMDEERRTNLSAITAALALAQSDKEVPDVGGDDYEKQYNYACGLIGKGRIVEAESVLTKVEKLAMEVLTEDGVSEEEQVDDVGLIAIQRAFCAQTLGREREAMGIYSRVLKSKPSDGGLIAVASNNILCVNKDQNIFDSKRRLKAIHTEGAWLKLNDIQRMGILINECLFYLQMQQVELCKEMCSTLEQKYPQCTETAIFIRAALVAKTEGIEPAKKLMETIVKKNPKLALTVKLGLVQHALREGKKDEAIALLRDLGKDNYRPGVISALVTLYVSQRNIADAATTLKAAVDYYRKSGTNKEIMNMLWRESVALLLQQGAHLEAAKSLEELRRTDPNDSVTLSQLIVAYAQFDIDTAKELSKGLPALPKPELDIGVLESPNWLAHVKLAKKGSSVPPTPATGEKDKKVKPKKKRKAKLPVDYDVNRQPDPERWLPPSERSEFKAKKVRKGRVDVSKGTQGADSGASAIFDMSGKVGQSKLEKSPVRKVSWRKDAHKKKKKKH